MTAPTTDNGKTLLEVKELKKYFPIKKGFLRKEVGNIRAVDDVSFYINEGETLSLVGESGCGKTTTARCILRAVDPSSGEILTIHKMALWWTWPACRIRSFGRYVARCR